MPGSDHFDRSCPHCGAATESITDCFTGEASALDNFDEVEDYLREQGLVSDDEYDLYADDYSRAEYENALAASDREPRDGPFITDSIVCTETWCTECNHSQRTYAPPGAVTDALTNGEVSGSDDLSDAVQHDVEQLLAPLTE